MAYRGKSRRGMAEYPGYYCYDADRPELLPYWLDDFTESKCKWSAGTIAGNLKACIAGDPSCGTPTAAEANPTLSGPGVAPPGAPTNVPVCSGVYTLNQQTNACELNILGNPLLLAGVGLFVVGLVWAGGRR